MMKKTKYLREVEEIINPLPSSIDDLPTPILHDILVRLPYKSLQRSKCVSKSWRSHISSHAFTVLHRDHSQELSVPDQHSPYRLLVFTSGKSLYTIDLDDSVECENSQQPNKISLPPSLQNLSDKHVVGCCNGLLLCVGIGNRDDDRMRTVYLFLLNPSTGAYREIPRLQVTYPSLKRNWPMLITYGLVYDCSTGDYKVIMLGCCPRSDTDVWVYSLRVGSWRMVARDQERAHLRPFFGMNLRQDNDNSVLIDNHLLHWLFVSSSHEKPKRIACFDGCNEEWSEVPLPDVSIVYRNLWYLDQLGVLDGCLCFLAGGIAPDGNSCEIMVMKEYGVKESWIKLFNISDTTDMGLFLDLCPIAYSRNRNEILLRKDKWSMIFWYNLRDKTTKTATAPREMQNMTMSEYKRRGVPVQKGHYTVWAATKASKSKAIAYGIGATPYINASEYAKHLASTHFGCFITDNLGAFMARKIIRHNIMITQDSIRQTRQYNWHLRIASTFPRCL